MARGRQTNKKLLSSLSQANGGLSDWAYERILDLLLDGDLRAGALLQERRLAEGLKISRTPVREALSRLEAEGLVTRQLGRLMAVTEITVQQYIDVLNVRKILEVEAAGLAAGQIGSAATDKIRAAISDLLKREEPSVSEHWTVDDLVHSTIAEAAKNHCLAATIRDLRRRTRIFNTQRIPGRLRPGALEHLALIEAVGSGDPEKSRALMAEHIENAKLAIIQQLAAGNAAQPAARVAVR
jgi:DNA-binding GntR family transcriptional regulator